MSFPTTPLTLLVELALAADVTADPSTWSWTDATAYVRSRDQVQIARGRPDENGTSDPWFLSFTADNTDGRWSSRNPNGAWYGQLRIGTPIRVSAEGHVRYAGFISALPPRWDVAHKDLTAVVEAKGLLYRLATGATPLRSAMRRALSGLTPAVYWPLEDGENSTQAASGLLTGLPLRIRGAVGFGQVDGPPGSDKVVDLGQGVQLAADVPLAVGSTSYRIELAILPAPLGGGDFEAVLQWGAPGGGVDTWELDVASLANGGLYVQWINAAGASDLYPSNVAVDDNRWHHIRIDVTQSGGSSNIKVYIDGALSINSTAAQTWSQVRTLLVNPTGGLNELVPSIGHLAVWTPWVSGADSYQAFLGYAGELAHIRFRRLCDEEGIPRSAPAVVSQAMGPQSIKTLLDLLRECEATDQAFLYESAHFGLTFQSHTERENLGPVLSLSYTTAGHVAPPLEPTDDDQQVINDVTVLRDGGSGYRFVESDPNVWLSIPNIGRRDESQTYSLATDDQSYNLAGWRLHMGTFPGYRFPVLALNLAAAPTLIPPVTAADLAFRATIANQPVDIGPDTLSLMVEGYTETLGLYDWDLTANCSPYGPYRVLALAEQNLGVSGSIVTAGAGVPVNLDKTGLNIDLTGLMLRLNITVDLPFKMAGLSLYLGVGGLTNYIQWLFHIVTGTTASAFKPGQATDITLQLSEIQAVAGTITLSSTGVPSVTSGFTDLRLKATDTSTGAITVTLNSVQLVGPVRPGAYCSICFDDSSDTVTTRAYPTMAPLGFRGSEYVIVESVGTADHVTLADLLTRYRQGWEVGAHSYTSASHTASYIGLTAAQVSADMASNKSWLDANFPHFYGQTSSYPKGEFFNTTDAVAVESLAVAAGYRASRTTLSNPGSTTHLQIESFMPPIMTRLYAASGISSLSSGQNVPANLIAAGGMLDKLESNGGWLLLVFHVITAGAPATTTECSSADFDSIMNSLAARNITVLPVRDVLETLDPTIGRLAPDSMDLLAPRDTVQTSWTVATVPAFTTAAVDYPIDLRAAGELVTATSASVVTPSFVAAGTADHADNAAVHPGMPVGVQAGDLLLVLAAVRSTTASPSTPAGYTLMGSLTNAKLFGRFHSGTESAPTVVFTGAAAGDTCSAQMAAFRGVSASSLFSDLIFNGSAQDIIIPSVAPWQIADNFQVQIQNAVIIHFAWKQDDWTSVAATSSFTQIGAPSSTLGNDQGIVWEYRLLTTPTSAFGPLVVTGGAAAISRGGVLVLRSDLYTFTVARSVNGVVKSQGYHEVIELDDPQVLAL